MQPEAPCISSNHIDAIYICILLTINNIYYALNIIIMYDDDEYCCEAVRSNYI